MSSGSLVLLFCMEVNACSCSILSPKVIALSICSCGVDSAKENDGLCLSRCSCANLGIRWTLSLTLSILNDSMHHPRNTPICYVATDKLGISSSAVLANSWPAVAKVAKEHAKNHDETKLTRNMRILKPGCIGIGRCWSDHTKSKGSPGR